MDLTIQLDNTKFNVRVAVLAKTRKGYVFEKSKDGYSFVIGGRIKIDESSFEAAQREIFEEIGFNIKNAELIAIVENFFNTPDTKVQEICFIYNYKEILEINLPSNFIEIVKEDLANHDIRPEIIKTIIAEQSDGISHYIIK